MVRELLLLQNQSGCLKSVRLPRLHTAEEAGARGGQTLVCGIHSGQAGRVVAGGDGGQRGQPLLFRQEVGRMFGTFRARAM